MSIVDYPLPCVGDVVIVLSLQAAHDVDGGR